MPNLRDLRTRIRSVKNTAKVTKAMQMIAASKMRRAQDMVRSGRPYSERIQQVLADLAAQARDPEDVPIPLLDVRPVERTLIVMITPDRGLAGGLVGSINRAVGQTIRDSETPVDVIGIGRKGQSFVVRVGGNLKAAFSVGDRPSLDDTRAISAMVISEYEEGNADQVLLAYSKFISTSVQRPNIQNLIPIEPASLQATQSVGYIFEPDAASVLKSLVPRYVDLLVYHAILEAIASEHSARMVAMQSATDNALELVDELTLDMNKARQEMVTSELLDIIGGTLSLKA